MTDTVVAVRERTGYREILDALVVCGISALPVLDVDDHVIGMVSETDLIPKVVFEACGDTAAELMSSPAVTIGPDASIVEAARLMQARSVRRLPVVGDEGRLAGIVTRRDLLRGCLLPDGVGAVPVVEPDHRYGDPVDRGCRYVFETGL